MKGVTINSGHSITCFMILLFLFCSTVPALAVPTVLKWKIWNYADNWLAATDSSGNVYVTVPDTQELRKYSGKGTLLWSVKVGSQNYGDNPDSVATDGNGNIYVNLPFSVQKFNSSGTLLWTVSFGNSTSDVVTDSSGNVYITVGGNNTLKKYNSSGTLLWTKATGNGPTGVATDSSGNIYVVNALSDTLKKYNSSGTLLWTKATGEQPHELAIDGSGNIYVVNSSSDTLQKFNSAGTLLWTKTTTSGGFPVGVVVDNNGDIYVTQTVGPLMKFNSSGTVLSYLGNFESDYGIATDGSGNVYLPVIDKISKIGPGCSGPVSISWTDPTITTGVTSIQSTHINELRSNINLRRVDAGISACTWTDATLPTGTIPIRDVYINELRTCISAVYTACGQAAPTFTDAITPGVTTVKAIHINELRDKTANAP